MMRNRVSKLGWTQIYGNKNMRNRTLKKGKYIRHFYLSYVEVYEIDNIYVLIIEWIYNEHM